MQLSCDLNPSPVASGEGFDYALIRSRAEENMELAKSSARIHATAFTYPYMHLVSMLRRTIVINATSFIGDAVWTKT